jgi:hypothetical protein
MSIYMVPVVALLAVVALFYFKRDRRKPQEVTAA